MSIPMQTESFDNFMLDDKSNETANNYKLNTYEDIDLNNLFNFQDQLMYGGSVINHGLSFDEFNDIQKMNYKCDSNNNINLDNDSIPKKNNIKNLFESNMMFGGSVIGHGLSFDEFNDIQQLSYKCDDKGEIKLSNNMISDNDDILNLFDNSNDNMTGGASNFGLSFNEFNNIQQLSYNFDNDGNINLE